MNKIERLIRYLIEELKEYPSNSENPLSYEASSKSEFWEAVEKLQSSKRSPSNIIKFIIDANDKKVYITSGKRFHRNIAKDWGLGDIYEIENGENKRYLKATGYYKTSGIKLDILTSFPSEIQRKAYKELKFWIKEILKFNFGN